MNSRQKHKSTTGCSSDIFFIMYKDKKSKSYAIKLMFYCNLKQRNPHRFEAKVVSDVRQEI